MLKSTLLAGAAVAAMAFAGTANAVEYTWSFSGGDNNLHSSKTFASSPTGVSVTARAYSQLNSNNLTTESLGWYTPGLGVTSYYGDSHTVDNGYPYSGSLYDLVIFEFASAIDINTIKLTSFGDADISVWFGSKGANNNFTDGEKSSNNFGGLSFLGDQDCNSGSGGNCEYNEQVTYSVNGSNLFGNYLVVMAQLGNDNDDFKITALTASSQTTVPEPGTLALLGLGLAGLGVVSRRKRA